jgi:hypothetical protein
MRWLTFILVVLLVGLAALPAAVGSVAGWLAHRAEKIESISYVPLPFDEFSASRRHRQDRQPGDQPPR